ncbi:hyperosmotically inducible protein [Idiomarina loihiensis]|uniref:BON domain-containing protein n=1 Tax=Idiomarina TaxID=135575 RepID=UPI000D718886|nr:MULTISPECIES: BON domain-containing protein [Idiomarina]PWW39449.1 hyperosmotically inducible protein [Idiomarina loihiensis]TDP49456.1 hyperosmotically inducible protein [Idiomarina loihiensis]TDS24230.1 hyperosmotically inducible protein [Idiomarina sp. H2]
MKNFKMALPASLIALSMLTISGCSEAETEKAESKAENAMQETKDAAQKAQSYTEKKAESAAEYVDDAVITTKVKAVIFEDDNLSSMNINVETSNGIVQLSGFVESEADIDTAENLAATVKGVKDIENNLQVREEQ